MAFNSISKRDPAQKNSGLALPRALAHREECYPMLSKAILSQGAISGEALAALMEVES